MKTATLRPAWLRQTVQRLRVERYGHWYRGRLTLTAALWQLGLTVDLFSFQIGYAWPTWRCLQLDFGLFALDVARLREFRPLNTTASDAKRSD